MTTFLGLHTQARGYQNSQETLHIHPSHPFYVRSGAIPRWLLSCPLKKLSPAEPTPKTIPGGWKGRDPCLDFYLRSSRRAAGKSELEREREAFCRLVREGGLPSCAVPLRFTHTTTTAISCTWDDITELKQDTVEQDCCHAFYKWFQEIQVVNSYSPMS